MHEVGGRVIASLKWTVTSNAFAHCCSRSLSLGVSALLQSVKASSRRRRAACSAHSAVPVGTALDSTARSALSVRVSVSCLALFDRTCVVDAVSTILASV